MFDSPCRGRVVRANPFEWDPRIPKDPGRRDDRDPWRRDDPDRRRDWGPGIGPAPPGPPTTLPPPPRPRKKPPAKPDGPPVSPGRKPDRELSERIREFAMFDARCSAGTASVHLEEWDPRLPGDPGWDKPDPRPDTIGPPPPGPPVIVPPPPPRPTGPDESPDAPEPERKPGRLRGAARRSIR